jgi:hypothetical protein
MIGFLLLVNVKQSIMGAMFGYIRTHEKILQHSKV